jgi:hypothetical protein
MCACGDALACRILGYVWPTEIQLATTSQWVFVAHVEEVFPLSPSEEAFASSASESVPDGLPFSYPTEKARVSLVRSLKGQAPATATLESSIQNCSGVYLEAGSDYLVFADAPTESGGVIAPIKGSFKLGGIYATTSLQKIDNHLILQAMKP